MANFPVPADLEAKLAQANTDDDVIQILADAGIQMTIDELKTESHSEDAELDETELENISGGSIVNAIKAIYKKYTAKNRSRGGGCSGALGGGTGGR